MGSGEFPSAQHTPYKLMKGEAQTLAASLEAGGFPRAARAVEAQLQEASLPAPSNSSSGGVS